MTGAGGGDPNSHGSPHVAYWKTCETLKRVCVCVYIYVEYIWTEDRFCLFSIFPMESQSIYILGVIRPTSKGEAELSTRRALSAFQGCFPQLFYGTLSQSRAGDLYVGKRPPNAKHSLSLRRVFSRLLQFARGFLRYRLLVVGGAFPGPQVCILPRDPSDLSKFSNSSNSFQRPVSWLGERDSGTCLEPIENPGLRPHPRPVTPGSSCTLTFGNLWLTVSPRKVVGA